MKRLGRTKEPVALVAVLSVATVLIVGSPPHLDTSRVMGIYALIALSLGISWGQGGMLSVSQAAFASVGAYATAIVTTNYGLPIALGFVLAVTLPAGLAYLVARIVVRLSHLALAISTLVLGIIVEYAIAGGGDFTGGFIGIAGIPSIPVLESRLAVHVAVWSCVVLIVLLYSRLRDSNQGRALRLIAKDRPLASTLGIPVNARLSATFGLSGAIAGLAGWFYAHTSSYLAPQSLPVSLSLTVVIMVVIGGRATVLGPVLGAVVVTLTLDLIPGAAVEGMFYGAVVVASILFFPAGILGTNWPALWRRLRSHRPPSRPGEPDATNERPGPNHSPAKETVR